MGIIVPLRPREASGTGPDDTSTTTFDGPSRVRIRDWAWALSVSVAWDTRRIPGVPLVRADGSVLIADPANADATPRPVGRMQVLKACLATGEDLAYAMTEVAERHEALAEVFDRYRYSEDFESWCESEHGQYPLEDPVFLLGLELDPTRVAEAFSTSLAAAQPSAASAASEMDGLLDWVAALAAIDALAVFGVTSSPLVVLDTDRTSTTTRGARALGAREWMPNVLVAFRPDP
ncbi:MAG: hypothetical protein H6721_23110 [Sandaracinus sp.]|nr:hypothetical protein [Sandaracinus sp.]MCB9635025.1 hypothetical protein [Sandaracinus sp.]